MPEPQVLVAGEAAGHVVALDEPLSFWGGFDVDDGTIIDHAHPQFGTDLAGAIVCLPGGRGSSSASSVLAEAIRTGTAPAALVLDRPDEILVLGAIVAEELYGTTMPVLVVDAATRTAIAGSTTAAIAPDGTVTVD